MNMCSELRGWHTRALAHKSPNPHSFNPRREDVKLVLLRNSPLEDEGFSLAIFSHGGEYVVMDAVGRVMNLPLSSFDIQGLLDLGRQTLTLPETGMWRNMWRVEHQITCQPIDRFFFFDGSQERQTSVYGYSPTETQLERPIGDYTHLPPVLQELFGLVLEARADYDPDPEDGGADTEMIRKVKTALDDIF